MRYFQNFPTGYDFLFIYNGLMFLMFIIDYIGTINRLPTYIYLNNAVYR